MAGFGRKGMGDDLSFGAGAAAVDGLSPQARAFLAAEGARKQQTQTQAPAPGQRSFGSALDSAMAAEAMMPAKERRHPGAMGERTMLIAYIFWWFAGVAVAAHRWYLGSYQGAIMIMGLFWGGLFLGFLFPPVGAIFIGISILWSVVDVFLIPGMLREWRQQYG